MAPQNKWSHMHLRVHFSFLLRSKSNITFPSIQHRTTGKLQITNTYQLKTKSNRIPINIIWSSLTCRHILYIFAVMSYHSLAFAFVDKYHTLKAFCMEECLIIACQKLYTIRNRKTSRARVCVPWWWPEFSECWIVGAENFTLRRKPEQTKNFN